MYLLLLLLLLLLLFLMLLSVVVVVDEMVVVASILFGSVRSIVSSVRSEAPFLKLNGSCSSYNNKE